MTFLDKKINVVKSVEKKLVFKNFSFGKSKKEKTLFADYSAAVKVEGGKLKRAFLWDQFPVHGSLEALPNTENGVRRAVETIDYSDGLEKRNFTYVAGTGEVYSYSEETGGFVADGLSFPDTPTILSAFTLDGRENLLYFSSNGVYFYDTAERKAVKVSENGSKIACLVGDRAFTAQGTRVYYCTPLAFVDWGNSQNGGGFLDFSSEFGEIVGLADVDGKLGVFFKHGVSIVSVRSGAKEFERRDIAFPFGEILSGSVCSSSNACVFLTSDGGYCLDGEEFEQAIPLDTFGEIAKDFVCESFTFQGDAYITYGLCDGKKRLFVYNGKSKQGYFVEEPNGQGMYASKDRLLCAKDGKIYQLSESGSVEFSTACGFSLRKTDLSFDGEKTLKSIKIKGVGQARIAVSSDRGGHVYTVTLEKDGSMVCPLLKGKAFDINFIPQAGCSISGAEIDVLYNGR